jgi:predicted nucleotidyltransferase component of viral defense system
MVFETGETNLKVEINHKKKGLNTTVTRFEKADGTYTDVLTLPPEDLILEKINAYSDRRFIRDIYDIYILSSYVENPEKIREKTTEFLKNIKKPLNENQLAALIYEGPVPSFNNMITIIKGRLT